MIHHVAVVDEAPGEIQKARAERHASLPWHHHRIAPILLGELLAIDRDHLERVGVDMKDVVVFMLVDDGPFLDRTERNALVDAIRVESAAADEEAEFLVVGGGWKFGLLDRQRQSPRFGDLLIADGSKRPRTKRGRERHRKRFTIHEDLGKRSDRRRVTLVVSYRPKSVRADSSGLHQHVGTLARRNEQTFEITDL